MITYTRLIIIFLVTGILAGCSQEQPRPQAENANVRITTNLGVIEIALNGDRAPVTVNNFIAYVKAGHYNGLIFHRVAKGFMIQGGGFEPGMRQRPAGAPIRNEADNGLRNLTGTIAMARTADPHSATAQFFINTNDNRPLDHRGKTNNGWGYTVFGKVTKGMAVVRKIENQKTTRVGPYDDVPVKAVIIKKIELLKAPS